MKLEPLGPNPLNRSIRLAHLDAHNAKTLATITRDTHTDDRERPALSRLGDEQQLRGIPVVGAPGVGGAINGTRPGRIR